MNANRKNPDWKVSKTKGGHFLLEYMPGVLGESGSLIRISEEVYRAAQNEEITLNELFLKYDLFKNEILTTIEPTVYPSPKPNMNTATRYHGVDFIATKEGNSYFLMYQLARHGGGSRKFEISKEIYEDARTGKYSTSDLFKKYNLYHLDVPENDVR